MNAQGPESREMKIGLLGCGTVGTSFAQLLSERGDEIERRTGIRMTLGAVAVRSLSTARPGVDESLLTTDSASIVSNPDIDIIVETMGGIDPTKDLIATALQNGKPVISANKELLAAHGAELLALAGESGVDLLFEASVAAGIPFIRALRESLLAEDITTVMGIVNGTTNYILSQMDEVGAAYVEALGEAQRLGYAEADPTADVEGLDAGAKAAIIATLAFGQSVTASDVYTEGISKITAEDIELARRMGYAIKLLAIVDRDANGSIGARVHPTMVPMSHPLASVRDSFNAVYVEGGGIDQVMFYGRGAGGHPTAAMMLGDAVDAATNKATGSAAVIGKLEAATITPMEALSSAFYISVDARDEPGVLAAIAGVFGDSDVSIRSMEQEGLGDQARLVFITHIAREADVTNTLATLKGLDVVKNIGQVLRVVST